MNSLLVIFFVLLASNIPSVKELSKAPATLNLPEATLRLEAHPYFNRMPRIQGLSPALVDCSLSGSFIVPITIISTDAAILKDIRLDRIWVKNSKVVWEGKLNKGEINIFGTKLSTNARACTAPFEPPKGFVVLPETKPAPPKPIVDIVIEIIYENKTFRMKTKNTIGGAM